MWALPLHYILKPIQQNIFPPIGIISVCVLFVFLLIQSVRLVLYKKDAILIQTVLCIIDPFFRIFSLFKALKQFPDSKYFWVIILSVVVYIIIDLIIIIFLNSKKNKMIFGIIEVEQEK